MCFCDFILLLTWKLFVQNLIKYQVVKSGKSLLVKIKSLSDFNFVPLPPATVPIMRRH